ncbi:phage integrase central domain-containing protein [Bradyrhizobium lupini]
MLDQLLENHGDNGGTSTQRIPQQHDHLREVAVGRGGRRIDTVVVVKVIKVEWKSAPQIMDRVPQRIGEVLRFAGVRGFRKPGPLPTR